MIVLSQLNEASAAYGFFKSGYKDSETRNAKDTVGNQQIAKDIYKRLLSKPDLLEEHDKEKVSKRLQKLKSPKGYF